jgi:hypothetical protein
VVEVLVGKKTWVGYSQADPAAIGSVKYLPKLRPGVLNTLSEVKNASINEKTLERMNFLYAKNYTIEKDFNLLLFNILNL